MKIAFLDRDGVINEDLGYISKTKDFIFRDGIFDFCGHLIQMDFEIAVVTNQSGLSRKFFTLSDYKLIKKYMLEQFSNKKIKLLEVMHCPHLDIHMCECRKPKPGMINKILKVNNAKANDCILVGDKISDIQAATSAGIKHTFLMSSSYTTINSVNPKTDFQKIREKLSQRN